MIDFTAPSVQADAWRKELMGDGVAQFLGDAGNLFWTSSASVPNLTA
jgi:hypothetical protein